MINEGRAVTTTAVAVDDRYIFLMMSTKIEEDNSEDMMICCAACGIAGEDDSKLKACDGCKSIHYCSDECQMDHRPQHERECNERAAELRDEILFKQPESSHKGDCPICFFAAIARSR